MSALPSGDKRAAPRQVTRNSPCEICRGTHKCSRCSDGLILCGRPPDHLKKGDECNGFVFLGRGKDDQWGTFRSKDDPVLIERQRKRDDDFARHASRANGTTAKPATGARREMQGAAADYAARLKPWHRAELANALGIPEHVLSCLPLLGFDEQDPAGPCWCFPECDSSGRVIGITRRWKDGTKKAVKGGSRGLTIPDRWQEREGAVMLPEGASDTLALTALGLPAIGRPSNTGGVKELIELLTPIPAERPIIVLGEWDPKEDGKWPGRDGAKSIADQLANALSRPVSWALPPDHAKDVRTWIVEIKKPAIDCSDEWDVLGSELAQLLDKNRQVVKPCNGWGLGTTCLASITPQPIDWLVPGVLPLGKLLLLAGDGGHGKSSLTLALAADLSQGRPCLGLDYLPEPACDVLLVGCEDDYGDTVVPRLLASGADLNRIHKVDFARDKNGKPTPFCLAHYAEMERELEKMKDIRLVVIDPAGAYIGRSVDDHKDSELRTLLDPMAQLAASSRVTIALVKHLNKGASAKAVHKVSGGAGYVNAVRAAYIVLPDENEPALKLLLPIKFNLGPRPTGLSYRLQALEREEAMQILSRFEELKERDRARLAAQLFRVVWAGAVSTDADSLTGASGKTNDPNKVQRCMEWMEKFLTPFAYPSEEINAAADKQGFTFDNVKEAKARLKMGKGLRHQKDGKGAWWSGFGEPSGWKRRPEEAQTANSSNGAPQFPHFPHFENNPGLDEPQLDSMFRVIPFDRR